MLFLSRTKHVDVMLFLLAVAMQNRTDAHVKRLQATINTDVTDYQDNLGHVSHRKCRLLV